MKKSIFFPFQTLGLALILVFVTAALYSQTPQGIPYQAVMRNADGTMMSNAAVNMIFKIHDGTASGGVVYEESHALTSNSQGLVSCVVGNGVVSQGNFSSIQWGSGAKFLHVLMGATDLGTQQMMSVPYALYAGACDISVSATGDTLFSGGGQFVIVPGISAANYLTPLSGCTNALACNYNAAATQDNGSCLIQGSVCDDNNQNTLNDIIDSSCNCIGDTLINGIYYKGSGVTDVDGNFYPTIVINNQEWMQKNLSVTKYRNGDLILTNMNNATWGTTVFGAYSNYNNQPSNASIYGRLYNFYTIIDSRGVCPVGWRVPTDTDWNLLINSLGGADISGGKMKSLVSWNSPNVNASNLSGFSVLASGDRDYYGNYVSMGVIARLWSNADYGASSPAAGARMFMYNDGVVGNYGYGKNSGFGIRCIKE